MPHRTRYPAAALVVLVALVLVPLVLAGGASPGDSVATLRAQDPMNPSNEPSRLAVLWTSGDREVALNVAFMYTHNAKLRGWFDEVTLIVWGPSALLLTQDEELQAYVGKMSGAGVEVVACRSCADGYGVSEALEALGVEVKFMGVPLTEMLKGDWKVITF